MLLRMILFMLLAALQGCASRTYDRGAAAPVPASTAGTRAAGQPLRDQSFSRTAKAAEVALAMLGLPYAFGGARPEMGFDCSGLVHFSFARAGLSVPRATEEQRRRSSMIPIAELRRGDLLFFDQDGRKNSHVAIYLGAGKFVHAPSSAKSVRTDAMSSPYWRKHLSEARRVGN